MFHLPLGLTSDVMSAVKRDRPEDQDRQQIYDPADDDDVNGRGRGGREGGGGNS